MDFIAELVLGLADRMLAVRLTETEVVDYLILRYRDDYRVFVHDSRHCEAVLKCLTEVMTSLGLRLNAAKTRTSSTVIADSIKPDKLAWLCKSQRDANLQRHLLIIYAHSLEFPNTGSVERALTEYYRRLEVQTAIEDPLVLISIAVDLAYRSPRAYPVCSAIIGKCLSALATDGQRQDIVREILRRFRQLPNTGHMEIWLQRMSMRFSSDIGFEEPLCRLAQGHDVQIWNSDWIQSEELKHALDARAVFDREIAEGIAPVISPEEVELFVRRGWYY
jgi:RNA-directed DNA polymerase